MAEFTKIKKLTASNVCLPGHAGEGGARLSLLLLLVAGASCTSAMNTEEVTCSQPSICYLNREAGPNSPELFGYAFFTP